MSKISEYPSATSLATTEIVPLLQGGLNKKATVQQFLDQALAQIRNGVASGYDTLQELKDYIDSVNTALGAEVTNRGTAVSGEATARTNADNTLTSNLATANGNLSTLTTNFNNHAAVGVSAPAFTSVHGIVPELVIQSNVLTGYVRLPASSTGALSSALASTNTFDLLGYAGSSTGAKGLYGRSDAVPYRRIMPAIEEFTRVPLVAVTSAFTTWTSMPAASTEIFSSSNARYRTPITLFEDDGIAKIWNQARIGAVVGSTPGAAGSVLRLAYYNGSALTAAGSPSIEVPISSQGVHLGAWQPLVSGLFTRETSAGLTELGVLGANGDGATSPTIGQVFVDFRWAS